MSKTFGEMFVEVRRKTVDLQKGYFREKIDKRLSLWRNRKAMNNTQPGKEKCQAIIDELEEIREEICGDEN